MTQDYYYSEQQRTIDRKCKQLVVARCMPFLRGSRVLDIGYVDNLWTQPCLDRGWSVDIIEGDKTHVEKANAEFGTRRDVRVFHSQFEAFTAERKYSAIITGDMIQYLADPAAFFVRAASWLDDDGVLVVTTPNSRSLHRRIGALLGMENHPDALNPTDIANGNRRTYDRYRLRAELETAGLEVAALHGCFLKPLSSRQMMEWSDELIRAYAEIGDELEDYAWFLYAVCRGRSLRK
jgi:2-polyprenyl-3-methyl-5-hydroxy-6-metoxy-1,4-benzoquinol methylase